VQLEWSAAAQADLARIYAFNVAKSEVFADRVETRLLTRADSLRTVWRQGRPLRETGLRVISVPDIQYVITYRVSAEVVLIIEVRSTREDRDKSD